MTSITIYNPTAETVHEASITKDARVFRKLGGDYYVELTLSVDKTLALPKGSYIRVSDPTTEREEKYALKKDASPEPISGVNGYKYVLKFYSRQHDMEACQIKWLAGSSQELSFRVTTSLRGFAQLIADNMNAYLDSDIWAYDESLDDTDMQEQAFEGVSCWDAINNIANAFGVEWWVDHGDQLTIRFGKCEVGNDEDAVVIKEGEIVNRFPAPKRGDDSNYGTRFYIFGGSQNVPESYRGNNTTSGGTTFHISEKRICLRKFTIAGEAMSYISYFDAVEGLSQTEIVEKTIILDDIFPKNETEIREGDILEQDENIIEGQDPQPVYYIKVDDKPTLLSTPGIKFTTGALAGRSFDAAIVEKNNTCQIKIIHTTENSGGSSVIAVPNANLAPKAGDTYILTGVVLDDERTEAAEHELWDKGTALALQYANDTNVYDCPVNPVYCKQEGVNLALGDKVILKGAHFGEKGRKSRIQGYEKKLYNPYIATYNIGDNSVYSRTLKAYKDASMPLMSVVASTERKNESLKAQISSSQSDVALATTIQRINDLEGYDTDTADKVSIPGAKKYAEEQAQDVRKYFEAITDKITDGNSNLIGLLFYGGTNISAINTNSSRLAFFTPSDDFNIRYNDFGKTDVQVNGTWIEGVSIVQKENYKYCKGAVIYIAYDVVTKNISDQLGFVLKTGDWLVATEDGWKKINCGTVRSIKGNNNVLIPDANGQIELGDVVTSIKSNGKEITMGAGGQIDLGNVVKSIKSNGETINPDASGQIVLETIGGASDAQIEEINSRIDGLEVSISANEASIKDAKKYAEEQATDAYNDAKTYVDGKASSIVNEANGYTDSKFAGANTYTDEKVEDAKTYTDGEVAVALADAKGYADGKASKDDIATAVGTALTDAKNYTDTRETAIKDAVKGGIKGTENFVMYAGKTFHTMFPTDDGIYIYPTTQFNNVYEPDKIYPVSGNSDIYVVTITKDIASEYRGAIIYISENIDAGVITDYELYKGDVIMAIGDNWVKINDTIVGAQYILNLMTSNDVYKGYLEKLTGLNSVGNSVDITKDIVQLRLPITSITSGLSLQGTFSPNIIYEIKGLSAFDMPWLNTSNEKKTYDNKWIIRVFGISNITFTKWKSTTTTPARTVYWNRTPSNESHFEIVVYSRRMNDSMTNYYVTYTPFVTSLT